MEIKKEMLKKENFGCINFNFTYHSYIYNRLYNNNRQSFALQLSPCRSIGNKELEGGLKK
ncbi:MAG: hypothetical protein ABIE36_03035 [Candidatus Diapherotrites archaeon]